MTTKELSYIEDALSHQKQLQTVCKDFANQIQDPDLKNFVSGLSQRHEQEFGRFYGLLNK